MVAWDHAGSVMGEKGRKKGWNRKNSSERSKLSGGEDYRLARFTRRFLFFYFFWPKPIFLSFSPNAKPGPWLIIEVGCVFEAPLHLVLARGMVFTQWYLTDFLLPFLINCLQAYLSCWGGEGVCNGLGWNDAMLLCKTGAASL